MLKSKTSYILFFLVVVIFGYIFFSEISPMSNKKNVILGMDVFDSEDSKNMIEIKIGDKILLKKRNEAWAVVHPYNDWANEERIEEFLSEIFNSEYENIILEPQAKETIFAGSKTEVVITEKSRKISFTVADKKNYENRSYVVNHLTGRTYLAEETLAQALDLPVEAYRNHHVFRKDINSLSYMRILKRADPIFIRKIRDQWGDESLDHELVKSKIGEFYNLQFLQVVSEDMFKRARTRQDFEIFWGFSDSKILSAEAYSEQAPSENRYMKLSTGQIYLVGMDVYENMRTISMNLLKDRISFLKVDRTQVAKMLYSLPKNSEGEAPEIAEEVDLIKNPNNSTYEALHNLTMESFDTHLFRNPVHYTKGVTLLYKEEHLVMDYKFSDLRLLGDKRFSYVRVTKTENLSKTEAGRTYSASDKGIREVKREFLIQEETYKKIFPDKD